MKLKYKYEFILKEDKCLCIFPDKPFWFIADKSIINIVKFYDELFDYVNLRLCLVNEYSYIDEEVDKVLQEVKDMFVSAGLFISSRSREYDLHVFDNNPPNPVINVTRNCNLNCKHCYADANNDKLVVNDTMDINTVKKAVDIVIDCSTDKPAKVLLSGGEPFIRNDIIQILEYIHEKGGVPYVNTNSLLIREDQMDKLCKYEAELLVSLDGATKETHEFIRGKNTYDRTIEQVTKLKAHNVITKLSITIHKLNLCELEAFINLAIKLNVDQIAVNPINILSRACELNLPRVNMKNFHDELARISKISKDHFKYVSQTEFVNVASLLLLNYKFYYCGVGAASLVIDYNGDLYPCYNTMQPELKLGNIKKDNILDIWKYSSKLKELRKLDINDFSELCRKCSVKYYCGGACRGEAYFHNKAFKSKCPYCEDMKESIIAMMFRLSEGNNKIFSNKIKELQAQMERGQIIHQI
ncbi:radical SAM/SPASM domain-containing protein [Clostridium akagii]|uniref:radical SAM/SPASM domain-containing protein n=1 Tax=Clostridium akagii TaxID=91623 RepID=UPI000478EC10|nr:radical SAM protein [Clostridium akagii]